MNPSGSDLRSFLAAVQQAHPDQLFTISDPVTLNYVTSAMVMRLDALGISPILLFENVQHPFRRLVTNLFSSREIIAFSIGTDAAHFFDRFGYCLDHLLPPVMGAPGQAQEVVLIGEDINLTELPVPIHFAEDAGPYITAGIIAARDPETRCGNLSFARIQIKGPRHCGISLHSRQHLWDYFRRAEALNRDLPVGVIIGGHPALMIAAAAKMGMDQDEYDLAGALLGEPIKLCPAKTVDIDIPANAEIVLEGYLKAHVREPEGPFAEYTGYSTDRSTQNVLEVTAVTMRQNPLYVDLIPGNSREHLTLGRISKEAWVSKRMKEALPYFVDFHYPASGTHYHCFVRIHKTAEGQARQAGMLLISLDPYVKWVMVVDNDIDPWNEQAAYWAMATQVQADRDLTIVSGVTCNPLDPSSDGGVGAKMIVDATRPLQSSAQRISLPVEAEAQARSILDKFLKT